MSAAIAKKKGGYQTNTSGNIQHDSTPYFSNLHMHDFYLSTTRFGVYVVSSISFESQSSCVACVMASNTLEDLMSSSGVDPVIASQFVTDGWTIPTFACVVADLHALDNVWTELVPHSELKLLQKSALRVCFKNCRELIDPHRPTQSRAQQPHPAPLLQPILGLKAFHRS